MSRPHPMSSPPAEGRNRKSFPVVANVSEVTTGGVLNPTQEPKVLSEAKLALQFKNLSPEVIDSAQVYKSKTMTPAGVPKLGLNIKGISKYVYADDMGMTPETSTAIEALPERAALLELRRLARYTSAMAGNGKIDMADIPKVSEPEISQEDLENASKALREEQVTKLGDKLTVMHPEPYVEEEGSSQHSSKETVILRKGSKTTVTQKYIVYETSDGHRYRVARGSFGAMVPSSAFPAMVNYMQKQKEGLEARAKALEVVLAASDKELGASAAEWLHVLLTTYTLRPNAENKAALTGAMNEFWATAKLGRSKAWDGIARRYNTALGVWAFIPSWLRPAPNDDGSIDAARRVAEISYAAAAAGARVTKEHGRTTIKAGSNIFGAALNGVKKAAKTAANTTRRAAKRAAKAAKATYEEAKEAASDSTEGEVQSYLGAVLTEISTFVSTVTNKLSGPLVKLWKWMRT